MNKSDYYDSNDLIQKYDLLYTINETILNIVENVNFKYFIGVLWAILTLFGIIGNYILV